MPKIMPPFLPPKTETDHPYTLILDLDETLGHYAEVNGFMKFLIRPGCEEFLQTASQFYEVVVFTAGLQDYADKILDKMDPERVLIQHRLYRHHTNLQGTTYIKDLNNLGRPLESMIIIDNVADNFKLQPQNGIYIKSWYDDEADTVLSDLTPVLV